MGTAPEQVGDVSVVVSSHLASGFCAGGASDTKLSAITGDIRDRGTSDRRYPRCCCWPTGWGRRSATGTISGRRTSDLRQRFSPSICRRRAPVFAPVTMIDRHSRAVREAAGARPRRRSAAPSAVRKRIPDRKETDSGDPGRRHGGGIGLRLRFRIDVCRRAVHDGNPAILAFRHPFARSLTRRSREQILPCDSAISSGASRVFPTWNQTVE